jgi:hypothetical protein
VDMCSSSLSSPSFCGIDLSTSVSPGRRVEQWLSSSVSSIHLALEEDKADDRYLLPICRFPPLILDIHGYRYPMYVTPVRISNQC